MMYRLLDNPVHYGWYTKWTCTCLVLWYLNPAYGVGMILPGFDGFYQVFGNNGRKYGQESVILFDWGFPRAKPGNLPIAGKAIGDYPTVLLFPEV
jgi:hypothetical protein